MSQRMGLFQPARTFPVINGVNCMKIKLLALAAVTAIGVVAINQPAAVAHHAFSAEFDANLPVRWVDQLLASSGLTRTLGFTLENNDPEATRDPGPWMVEGGTPNTLLRRGINRNSLTLGRRHRRNRLPV